MQVADITEHEDGSATINFDLTPQEVKQLLEYALQKIIREYVNTLPKVDE